MDGPSDDQARDELEGPNRTRYQPPPEDGPQPKPNGEAHDDDGPLLRI